MNRKVIEKYKDRYVVIGIPHTKKKHSLFFYKGIITAVDNDTVTLTGKNEEMVIEHNLIRTIKVVKLKGDDEK